MNRRYSGRYKHCLECGERLPARVKKYCSVACKTKNRNARRRERYAASK